MLQNQIKCSCCKYVSCEFDRIDWSIAFFASCVILRSSVFYFPSSLRIYEV